MKISFFLLIVYLPCISVTAQERQDTSSTRGGNQPAVTPPKLYTEVITSKAKTDEGLFKVHKIDQRYYFEIPDSLLGRDILVVNRISKAPAGGRGNSGMMGYAGDQIGENILQFAKGPSYKMYLKNISYQERSYDSTKDGMYYAVERSNIQPLVFSFDIKAYSKDSLGVVIDVTNFINGDNDILFFESSAKNQLSLAAYQADRSYVEDVKSFPLNVEIKSVKTYLRSGSPSTFELNSSIVLLPKTPMTPRYSDRRVGYFSTNYYDFDKPQGVEQNSIIKRWKLEPRDEDVNKYKKGELVEPKKQIVFYIDPVTPKKWVPYLIQGVSDWNIAFERAGFKNAIVAKEAQVGDPEWSLEDARHSVIVYKPSVVPNASGPSIVDPRSGEIIESHINWYHNVMKLIHDWYMIQASPNDPRARKMQFDDELMGQLIRFVSSHEVGHTLGLMHNFGASSTVSVEKLRDKKWVEENGFCPSIMDYARFNYVAQPEDSITSKGIFPRIGEYDKWAIEWGYRNFTNTEYHFEEKEYLNKWVIASLDNNQHLYFGSEQIDDPRNQSEDLGSNAMQASSYGIKNLQFVMKNLTEWTKESNEDYSSLSEMYTQVINQYRRYLNHVANNIGGLELTPKTSDQPGKVYQFVSRAKQKEAMKFLDKELFSTPKWVESSQINALTGQTGVLSIASVQQGVINKIMSHFIYRKMFRSEGQPLNEGYELNEFLTDLKNSIWKELKGKSPIDKYRRTLQKLYTERLISNIKGYPNPGPTISIFELQAEATNNYLDVKSVLKEHLRMLQLDIKAALSLMTDPNTKMHLRDVLGRINEFLNLKDGQASSNAGNPNSLALDISEDLKEWECSFGWEK